ncbi:hypothetical protein L1887_43408 [Cichorium endivia]|nr:hypothetical protein L1887_43408 [Cichorium endivia]
MSRPLAATIVFGAMKSSEASGRYRQTQVAAFVVAGSTAARRSQNSERSNLRNAIFAAESLQRRMLPPRKLSISWVEVVLGWASQSAGSRRLLLSLPVVFDRYELVLGGCRSRNGLLALAESGRWNNRVLDGHNRWLVFRDTRNSTADRTGLQRSHCHATAAFVSPLGNGSSSSDTVSQALLRPCPSSSEGRGRRLGCHLRAPTDELNANANARLESQWGQFCHFDLARSAMLFAAPHERLSSTLGVSSSACADRLASVQPHASLQLRFESRLSSCWHRVLLALDRLRRCCNRTRSHELALACCCGLSCCTRLSSRKGDVDTLPSLLAVPAELSRQPCLNAAGSHTSANTTLLPSRRQH